MAICHLSTLPDGKSDVFRVPGAYDQHMLTRREKVQPCDAPIIEINESTTCIWCHKWAYAAVPGGNKTLFQNVIMY